jgi:hypothetical protein
VDETSIFRWDTIREVGPETLPFPAPIAGLTLEIELTSGSRIKVFRADDGAFYFCHGLTFGGKNAPGGAVSPYSGKAVTTILADFFKRVVPEANAIAGDIVVWYDLDGPSHSAILVKPIAAAHEDRLDYSSVLRSKNGYYPEATVTLQALVEEPGDYGETYVIYRRR